ncbi:Myosin-16 [Vitis vinifera]|uniref:Myosin-16 n=1 Tax=Vitis vinifera TaxID=29760 RepID=A0A438F0H2_VITVI|nr:Myosin-16 [Vitis vinifera]
MSGESNFRNVEDSRMAERPEPESELLENWFTRSLFQALMIYSMSEQVSALKMILHTSSNSSSTSGSIARYDRVDVVSSTSDATSTASDFTFPTPVPSSVTYSSFHPDALQMIVQDLSVTEISGSEHWKAIGRGHSMTFFDLSVSYGKSSHYHYQGLPFKLWSSPSSATIYFIIPVPLLQSSLHPSQFKLIETMK